MLKLDEEDEHLRHFYTRHSQGYWLITADKKQHLLYRYFMQAPQNMTVDHKNNDREDCRKRNLRVASYADNNINTGKKSRDGGTTSKYKGVYKYANRAKPYWAYIRYCGLRISLGYFSSEEEAANAYNEAALKYHGDFAKLNKIER